MNALKKELETLTDINILSKIQEKVIHNILSQLSNIEKEN